MNVVSLCQSISLYCTYLPFFLLWWCARRQQQPDETGEANGAGTVTWREAVSEGESSASGRRSTGAAESTTVDNRETIVINWHLPWRQMRSYDLDLDYVPCAFTYTNSHQVAYSPHVLLCLWAVIALKKKICFAICHWCCNTHYRLLSLTMACLACPQSCSAVETSGKILSLRWYNLIVTL